MRSVKFILLLMFTIPFLTGFSESKSKVDFVQGIWKCEVANNKGYISFLEIGKDYIVFYDYDGYREDGLILEETEGVVLVRKAGMSEIISRIIIRDDEHIIVEFPGRKISFIRSSAEEKNNIFKPPVANITGLYQSQDGMTLFEFSESIVVKNGVPLDVSLFSEDQMYFAVRGDVPQFALTPIEDGRLLYHDRPGGLGVILAKVPQEEVDAIKARLSVQISNKELLPVPMGLAPWEANSAPPRRNTASRIRVLDSDATMRLLAHRYGEYMEPVARQLQESFKRVVMLSPLEYTRGSARIRFGIAPDGSLSYFETEYPTEAALVNVRLTSEQMLREAAPFAPPTAEMLADPNFQQMSVTVFLE